MPKEQLSVCCNAAILEFKESDETVCLACYHTTDVQENLELDGVRDRVGLYKIELHRIVGQLIFLIVLIKIVDLILFLL